MRTVKPVNPCAESGKGRTKLKSLGGFKLIELLVVVAIIALLVSILVPSLHRAREEAQKAVCLANLHSIGIAVHCYVNDCGGRMPGYNDDKSDWPVHMGHMDTSYIHDQWCLGGNSSADNCPNSTNPNKRKLNLYVSNAETVFRCPADQGDVNVSPRGPGYWYDSEPYYYRSWGDWLLRGNSYLYNAVPGVGNNHWRMNILAHKQMAAFKHPGRQVVMGDATLFYTWMDPWTEGYGSALLAPIAGAPWHDLPKYHRSAEPDPLSLGYGYTVLIYDPLANLLFLDGHASTVRLQQDFMTADYIIYDYESN